MPKIPDEKIEALLAEREEHVAALSHIARILNTEGLRPDLQADSVQGVVSAMNRAERDLAEALAVLREVEWVRDSYDDHLFCQACNAPKKSGHASYCPIARALASSPGAATTPADGAERDGT
jgi:hypothetical protein